MEIKYINKDTEKYKLIFSNVTLKAGSKTILENESFNITYNNMVILKGPIGSGKSSILKAVAGIYRIENGEILSTCNDDKVEAIYIHSQPELNFITGYIKDMLRQFLPIEYSDDLLLSVYRLLEDRITIDENGVEELEICTLTE